MVLVAVLDEPARRRARRLLRRPDADLDGHPPRRMALRAGAFVSRGDRPWRRRSRSPLVGRQRARRRWRERFVPSVGARSATIWARRRRRRRRSGLDRVRALHRRPARRPASSTSATSTTPARPAEFDTKYHGAYGRMASITAPTPGNHEWPNCNEGYKPYWREQKGVRVACPTTTRSRSAGLADPQPELGDRARRRLAAAPLAQAQARAAREVPDRVRAPTPAERRAARPTWPIWCRSGGRSVATRGCSSRATTTTRSASGEPTA